MKGKYKGSYGYRWWTRPARSWFKSIRHRWFRWLWVPDLSWLLAQESLRRLGGNYKGLRRVRHGIGLYYYTTKEAA